MSDLAPNKANVGIVAGIVVSLREMDPRFSDSDFVEMNAFSACADVKTTWSAVEGIGAAGRVAVVLVAVVSIAAVTSRRPGESTRPGNAAETGEIFSMSEETGTRSSRSIVIGRNWRCLRRVRMSNVVDATDECAGC
ncbi:MAG: hypothetical protein ACP5XB_16675 [Isosphaeraceae bacterium]